MKWKRWCAALACLLMLSCMTMTVAATPDTEEELTSMETVSKVYSMHISTVQGFIQASPQTPAFWEYPMLRGGEDYVEGMLILRNDSEVSTSLKLSSVSLPYGDVAKLSYLDHLMLTVKDGDTVIYNNTYAHVNDAEGGLHISLPEMTPGEEKVYTIKLRCLYSYGGDETVDAPVLNWNFEAKMLRPLSTQEVGGLPDWVGIILIVAAVTVFLVAAAVIVYAVQMARTFPKDKEVAADEAEKKDEIPVDKDENV